MPLEAGIRELVARPVAGGRIHRLSRLTAPVRSPWFWAALWAAAATMSFAALIPLFFGDGAPLPGYEILHRLSGVSFAACGLVAWHRRPDSLVGMLLTAAGFGVLVGPVLDQLDSPLAFTLSTLIGECWIIAFVTLILTFVTGGRLISTVDRVLVALFFIGLFVGRFVTMLFFEHPDNLLLAAPNAGLARAVDKGATTLLIISSLAVVLVVVERWRSASAPRRRALLPSVGGSLCGVLFAAWNASLLVGSPVVPLVWI